MRADVRGRDRADRPERFSWADASPLAVDLGLLVKDESTALDDADRVESFLADRGYRPTRFDEADDADCDVLIVVGDSSFLIDAFTKLDPETAVLGVGSGGLGVLTQATRANLEEALTALVEDETWVEEVTRISCKVDGRETARALNEVALMAGTGGHFLSYTLVVDDDPVFRDRGDGVIVSTPTGSTAYALAAGGPVISEDAPVLGVVPICSDEGNKPLVVPKTSRIEISDMRCEAGLLLAVDGRDRVEIDADRVVLEEAAPARFVRFEEAGLARRFGKLKEKKELGVDLKEAPPSARFIFKLLEYEGPLTAKEVVDESGFTDRTVRSSLNWLTERGIVESVPSLRDLRQERYDLARRRPRGTS